MDRLLCGDVGFGKTEVAIRSVFKAVLDGKQVAVLAPTTILVDQHMETFRDRFLDFPVEVEMLSRFVTPSRSKEVSRVSKRAASTSLSAPTGCSAATSRFATSAW